MAKLKRDSINLAMFTALKVSEKSGVPVMFLSNPGVGKSTTVEMFAEIRGYELILLRGNSTTAEEINGYDTAGEQAEKTKAATHLRPSWFQQVLKNDEEGKKTLLFLDEITTTDDRVQAALLHLVFGRMVDTEKLPESTLIVSAGNYAQNLSDSMEMLPPTLNRFMIYNLELTVDDLDLFMNKYQGAILGNRYDYKADLKSTMIELDQAEAKVDEDYKAKVGEYLYNCITDSIKFLTKDGQIDLNFKELKNIYVESVEDYGGKVYGFVTPRVMNYLGQVALETFLCFGKAGISSKTFLNMIDGLCGAGLVMDKKTKEPKMNLIGKEIHTQIITTVNEVEKMKNNKLPHYVEFFSDVISKGKKSKSFDSALIQSLINKVNELSKDPDIENISNPIESAVLEELYEFSKNSISDVFGNLVLDPSTNVKDSMSVEDAAKFVISWNLVSELLTSLGNVVTDGKFKYNKTATDKFKSQIKRFNPYRLKVTSIRNYFVLSDKSLGSIIPEIKSIILK